MLAITRTCFGAACPQPDPNVLFKKLTSIKVLNAQIISNEDARGISDELITTVRCNAEDAARKVIVPAVAIAGIAAVIAGVVAVFTIRQRRHALGALGARYRVTVRYRKFPTPTSLCVEAPNKDEAAALVSGGAKGVKIMRVARGC